MTSPTNPLEPLSDHVYAAYGVSPTPAAALSADQVAQQLQRAQWEAGTTAAVLEILLQVQSCEEAAAGGQVLVDRFRELADVHQVAVGLTSHGKLPLQRVLVSGSPTLDGQHEAARHFEAALAETLLQPGPVAWPAPDLPSAACLAISRLLTFLQADWIVSCPLVDAQERTVGAWLCVGKATKTPQQEVTRLLAATSPSVAASLQLLRRAQRNRVTRWLERVLAGGQRWKLATAAVLLCVVMLLSLLPVPYRMHGQCRVEPVVRRTVCAPFAGLLEQSLVEPGDLVPVDQPVARMDGRELRLEIGELAAERDRAALKRSSSVARHELGAARMAELEVDRLELQLRLLEQRSTQLVVKSPVRGVVLQGDLRRVEGMPVELGQKLLEVAPLEQMLLEVAIAERDYPHAAVGQKVVVRLDAYPGRKWHGQLRRIHPATEEWESDYVFVGELEVSNSDELLRPGMTGTATIVGARHPWVWNVLHRSWENVAAFCGY